MLSLFIDEDSMRRGLVRGLRAAGLDVVTVTEAARRGLSDEDQLAYAAAAGRALYTCNVRDFARLHSTWVGGGRHHAGIIVLIEQSMGIGAQIGALTRLCSAYDAVTMRDQIIFLSDWIEF